MIDPVELLNEMFSSGELEDPCIIIEIEEGVRHSVTPVRALQIAGQIIATVEAYERTNRR